MRPRFLSPAIAEVTGYSSPASTPGGVTTPKTEKLTAAQRSKIRRLAAPKEIAPDEEAGELNIVPFLDIITNVLMFVLATLAVVCGAAGIGGAVAPTRGGPPPAQGPRPQGQQGRHPGPPGRRLQFGGHGTAHVDLRCAREQQRCRAYEQHPANQAHLWLT